MKPKEAFCEAVIQVEVHIDEYDNIVYREQEWTLAFDVFEIPYIFDVFEIPFLNPRANELGMNTLLRKTEASFGSVSSKRQATKIPLFSIVLQVVAPLQSVAEKLGRRWIVADLNKGAIQTTMRRIQLSICLPLTKIDKPRGIAHYRVNNYDASTHLERRNIVIKKCGVQIDRQGAVL